MQYFNRELSWIEFNARVMAQALKKDLPLFERLQFLSIVTSNFDEFFQVRVASVKRAAKNDGHADVDGIAPADLLKKISARAHQIIKTQNETLIYDILPELDRNGLSYVGPRYYTAAQQDYLRSYFKNEIFPLLQKHQKQIFMHIKNILKETKKLLVI